MTDFSTTQIELRPFDAAHARLVGIRGSEVLFPDGSEAVSAILDAWPSADALKERASDLVTRLIAARAQVKMYAHLFDQRLADILWALVPDPTEQLAKFIFFRIQGRARNTSDLGTVLDFLSRIRQLRARESGEAPDDEEITDPDIEIVVEPEILDEDPLGTAPTVPPRANVSE